MRQQGDDAGPDPAASWVRAATPAIATTVGGVLPAFLTGALAVQIADDLDIEVGRLGIAFSAFFVGAAVSSVVMGRWGERLGPTRALRAGAGLAAAVMLAIAALARSYPVLVGLLVLGGVGTATVQPAANLLLARRVPAARQGIAFAVKQSGMPVAALLGGAAVPLVALTVGWRWAYVGGAAIAAAAGWSVPRARERHHPRPEARATVPRPAPLGPLVALAVAVGLGAAAASSLVTFYVAGGVDAGLAEGTAGWALTAGSALGIASRLRAGTVADRRGGRHLPVVSGMLLGGVAGFGLLAVGQPVPYLAAVPLAFGAGWAWPGLFNLAVVRNYPDAPGAATGVTQTGTYMGGIVGPMVVGALVDHVSFGVGFLAAGAASGVAAVMMSVARGRVMRARTAGRGR